jgi:hypothetical protein
MTFKQAMIVPTMATLGIGALLMAQNLSLMEVGYAAPAASGAQEATGTVASPAEPAGKKGKVEDVSALPPPSDSAIAAEFGPQTGGKTIKAISDAELAHRAVEASGREDPFMALVPPDPGAIVPPPVSFGPIKPIPQMGALPPIGGGDPRPGLPTTPSITPITGGTPVGKPSAKPVEVEDLPFQGDKAPPVGEPQWLVRGIMQINKERITMLEGKDQTIRARVGEVLPDGSRVEAISSRGVTLSRGGRRFVKQIGGTN